MNKNMINLQKLINRLLLISLITASSNSVGIAEDVPVKQNSQQVFVTPDYSGDLWSRQGLTGDWDGERQKLANQGITLDANYTQSTLGVVSGGLRRDWGYYGRGETTLNLDTAKMGLWPGGLLTVIGEGNFGNNINRDAGALLPININEVLPEPEDSFVIPNVSYTQFFSPKFGISLGKFATIRNGSSGDMNEFAHGKGSHQFMNLSFNVNPTTALTVPYSTLGAGMVYLPSEDLVLTANVLDPHGKPNSAGFDRLFENGATFALEGRYKTGFFGKTGHQLLGSTYSTSDYNDLDQNAANLIIPGLPTQEASKSWSTYWNMDQYFYQPDSKVNKGVGIFARAGLSDGDANPIRTFASVGIGGKGIIPCRENDSFGIGHFYNWTADNVATSQLGFGDGQGLEAYYEFAITPAFKVSPDIQWISPSQTRVDSSWVTGIRVYTAL